MGFQTNNSNRVLLNFINQEDFFGRILYVDGAGDVVEHSLIRYGDLIAGGTYNFDIFGNGELILNWKDPVKYKELVEFMQVNPCVLEVFIYEDYNNLAFDEFNKFYFFDYLQFENDIEDNEISRQFKFHTFTTAIESKTMIEHNVEYNFGDIPTDTDGRPILPDDFNQFRWDDTFEELIFFLYDKTLFNPTDRLKGSVHGVDTTRELIGFGTVGFNVSLSSFVIEIIQEKQSLYDIRLLAQFYLKEGDERTHIPEIKLNSSTKKLDIIFNFTDEIALENGGVKDNFTYFKKEIDYSDDIANMFVESTGDNDLSYTARETRRSNAWKVAESIGSGTTDETESLVPLQTVAESEITKRDVVDSTELDIDFKDKEIFKDINSGQLIDLLGYGDEVDGRYRILAVSCIINETYLSYAIDSMERI